jgi:hypothetical protein
MSTRYRCFEMRSVTKRRPELLVQTLAALHVRWRNFLLVGACVLAVVPLPAVVHLLVGARWGAFSGFIPKLPVVPADLMLRLVVGSASAGSGFRTVAFSGLRMFVGVWCAQGFDLQRDLDTFQEPGCVVDRRRGDACYRRLAE